MRKKQEPTPRHSIAPDSFLHSTTLEAWHEAWHNGAMPLSSSILFSLLLALILTPSFSQVFAAEDDVLLTIEGNLIDRIVFQDSAASADVVISSYYQLLPLDAQADIGVRRSRLERLQPDYEVAFLAADSAEMAEIREKIDEQWVVIRSLHRYFFTSTVVDILNQAYIDNFDGLLPEESEL